MSYQSPRSASPAYRFSRVLILFVYGLAITCIVILAISFFLQLFNANATAPFVDWVYRATKRIMQPFRGIFPSVEGEQGSVFDVSMLFAMFMYGLLAFGMNALIAWIDRKIAAARNELIWQSSATPARNQDVVTIPVATPPAPPTVPAATTTPAGPPAAPGEAPGDRR
jgi:uncharacterized protein YggT (Ycf19 family)